MKYVGCFILLLFIVVAVALSFALYKNQKPAAIPAPLPQSVFDGRNATYTINSESFTLANGISEIPAAPDSASFITTEYFGNEAKGDLDGDGLDDEVFLITQNTGGTGTFYYAVAALQTTQGYKTTNAFLIGDRIAPQSTEIQAGEIHVNFAERNQDEPFTTPPSHGAVLLLKVGANGVLEGFST